MELIINNKHKYKHKLYTSYSTITTNKLLLFEKNLQLAIDAKICFTTEDTICHSILCEQIDVFINLKA